MNCRAIVTAILPCLMLMTGPALAEPIGNAVRIVNKVTGSLEQARRDITVGDGVNQNEAIEVATDALGELKLNDDSKIALGPGARLVLDKFVYDPSRASGAVSVNLAKGAFRFITGLSRKQDYKLRTPSASIAVRGTVFDVYVDENGDTWLLLLEGSVQVCNTGGQCTDVTNPCGVVRIPATGAFEGPQGWPVQARQINFDTAFPFVGTPPSIDAKPLFTRTAVELNQCTAKKPNMQKAEATEPNDAPPSRSDAYAPARRSAYGDRQTSQPTTPVSPPPVVTRNFSGAYIGLVAGAVWQRPDPFLDCYDYTNSIPRECSTYASFAIPANVFDLNDAGFLGGGQIGYNVALGNVVVGVEADIAYTDIESSETYVQPLPCCTRDTTLRQELSSLSTVRGRLGYAFDNVLLFVTGGLAVGQVEYAFELVDPSLVGGGFAADSKSKLAVGYTAGAGVELSLGQWSLKTEYLFYDLGQESLTAPFLIGGVREPFTFRPEFETQGHILRVGTNFRLN